MFKKPPLELETLYQDEYIIAINKPHGLAVHRSYYIGEADTYAIQELKAQIGQKVYLCHRLDRKTSGILLFALNKEMDSVMQVLFAKNQVKKKYLAIVRGFTEDSGVINYALTNEKGKIQEALTEYKTIQRSELNLPFGKFKTSRYSLVEVSPQTGRMHQIRKHFAHIMHPIIGDRPHGCNKQNRLFMERFEMTTMMLHASELEFTHPITKSNVLLKANIHSEFNRMKMVLGW